MKALPNLFSGSWLRPALASLIFPLSLGTAGGEGPAGSPLALPAGVPMSAVQIQYEFSTLAGAAGQRGWLDGKGSEARFLYPPAVAVDSAGVVYVADYSQVIRRISPTGEVTTIAGRPGSIGSADGRGDAARFNFGVVNGMPYFAPTDDAPLAIGVDREGHVYVADSGNGLVRKVTPQGVVTTVTHVQSPAGLAVDAGGAVYVTEAHAIKRILPQGSTTVLAGNWAIAGSRDGPGGIALFQVPRGLAVDAAGNVFVADSYNSMVRKIAPDGFVSTLAGTPGILGGGAVDGTGSAARFKGPSGIAVDRSGALFVTDLYNHTIRQISPDGVVTTLAGQAGDAGTADLVHGSARFNFPDGIAVDGAGNLYVADSGNHTIRKGTRIVRYAPVITREPRSQTATRGETVVFEAKVEAAPAATYQWLKNGVALEGATADTLVLTALRDEDAGVFSVVVKSELGTAVSVGATLTVSTSSEVGRLINVSALAEAGQGEQTLCLGVVVAGVDAGSPAAMLVRAAGPALSAFGVERPLVDPRMEVSERGVKVGENDDWAGDPQLTRIASRVGAFPWVDASSRDAAYYHTPVSNGAYDVVVTTKGGATGRALAEIYDATPVDGGRPSAGRWVNLSVRARVGGPSEPLVVGVVVGGSTARTVLVRAVGPGLLAHGISDVIPDPRLEVYSGTELIGENDDGSHGSGLAVTLPPMLALPATTHERDAALLVTLPPGSHTVRVMGAGETGGVVLVELMRCGDEGLV